jgi:predicted ATPase/class 3 adenylate cyclase
MPTNQSKQELGMTDLPTGTVTFLFSDIEGSTRLLNRLGERYKDLLEEHGRLLRTAFGEAGGYAIGTEGDSFFVVFRSAPAAVAGAVEGQRRLDAHEWPDGETVRVRMGLHTGEGKLGGENYIGIDVHRAARITSAAGGGQVLLSGPTHALVEGSLPEGVTVHDLGQHRLKDLEAPEHIYQLVIPDLPDEFPPIRSLDARPNNLPTQLTSFVGRDRLVEQAQDVLASTRLVTLTGPGGTGKTRLSIHLGQQLLGTFEHGVFFVALASITDPALVGSTVAHTLGLAEEGTRPILETLKDHLRDRELLLLLDNFEQVTEAAPVVAELLSEAARLKALVTSREVLRVSGEHEFPVPPMELPDVAHLPPLDALTQYEAVSLFIQRAKAVHPGFEVTEENAPAVAEICARLDGLPLAIELAAARVRVLSPQAILGRLSSRLGLLTGGARDLPRRQQTLRDAIDWSYDLLDEQERTLFARLSVFVSGWSLEAAEAVCNPDGELPMDILDALGSLVDKSLLRRLDTDAGEPRFRMLQVIREYAMERLAQAPDVDEIRGRHGRFYAALAQEAFPHLQGSEQATWLDTLEMEHDNLRAAVEWFTQAEPTAALELGANLWRFWQKRGFLQEARQRIEEILAAPGSRDDPAARARGLDAGGGVAYWQGDFEHARAFYQEALAIFRERGDRTGEADQLYNISFTYSVPRTDFKEAERLGREALEIFRELNDMEGESRCLWGLAWSALQRNDREEARQYLTAAQGTFRELNDVFGLGWALHSLGILDILEGRLAEADQDFREALTVFAEARDITGIALLADDFSWLAYELGYRERGVRLAGAARAVEAQAGTGLVAITPEDLGRPNPERWLVDDAARAAWAEGEAMSTEEIVAYALKDPADEGSPQTGDGDAGSR